MDEKKLKKIKSILSDDLHKLLVQVAYGNVYDYMIDKFISDLVDIIETEKESITK